MMVATSLALLGRRSVTVEKYLRLKTVGSDSVTPFGVPSSYRVGWRVLNQVNFALAPPGPLATTAA